MLHARGSYLNGKKEEDTQAHNRYIETGQGCLSPSGD
jgi:hypothetical protein